MPKKAQATKEGKTWSMRRRVLGQDFYVSGHRTKSEAEQEMKDLVDAQAALGKPKGFGPLDTTVAQALQDMALERLKFLKSAVKDANRINRWLRAAGMATLKVTPWAQSDAARKSYEELGVPPEDQGVLFCVTLEPPAEMSDNVEYYRQFAAEFFRTTVAVDMTALRQRFLAGIPAGARILDAGCGSGRDAKAFAEQGFEVTAFDATPELAALATEHCGFPVSVRRFEDVAETSAYDGIWCCASLLHVPVSEMHDALSRLWAALAPGGTLYVSLKHGRGERLHNGRRFTDADEETIRTWFRPFAEVRGVELWLTRDQRPERDEVWTNALITKEPSSGRRLVTGETDHFLPHLSAAIASATEVELAVAFIKTTGLRLLLPDLQSEHLERFSPQHFDYVVVDEFHHAAATTYRRLLAHFSPAFLLGLTATPDRTDQSDILSLCDDNLVFSCHLFEGIRSGLLAPFHYYGIHDESVDYREVPWRSGRFDHEALSNKLATLARARHALKEWRQRSQQRTLAFCVSTRHADFMAEQFRRAGVNCAAVYSGSELGRAQALELLSAGELKVLFTVDLFNEGVDHWIDEYTFHWQSQNQTSPDSKRGQEIIQHQARGITIHLFVRDEKLAGGKAAPFTYFGRVTYRSHQGSEPMSVVFSVDGP